MKQSNITNKKCKTISPKILIVIITAIILIMISTTVAGCSKTSSSAVHLSADVSLEDNRFVITNRDDYDWKNVKLVLNNSYHYMEPIDLKVNETYIAEFDKFFKRDGLRFDALTTQVSYLVISVTNPSGKTGSLHIDWTGD